MEERINLPTEQVRMLLIAGDGDAALLYLWLRGGKAMPCPLTGERLVRAKATLTRLGLEEEQEKPLRREVRPTYTEDDVTKQLQTGKAFGQLVGEAQRILGRVLSTEELKCLLSIQEYLRLPLDVVSILISYCVQRNRARGVRAPSMRTIEKEAYRWSDEGVDCLDTAVRFVQMQMARQSRHGRIAAILQISGRRLTQAEENYVNQWVDWGFGDDAIRLAYEKTCLNTGSLKWPYLNSILSSWHEKGLRTVEEIRKGDGGGKKTEEKKPALGESELEILRRLRKQKEG